MPLIAILADDFTGACDTGLQFARAGLRVRVSTGVPPGAGRDVLVQDTGTRNAPPEEAARRIGAAGAALAGCGASLWYKKIDSTLRGQVAAELKALMEALGFPLCLMAPAFPEAGRTTVGGYHLLDGAPVARTRMGEDRGAPARHSSIPRLLAERGLASFLIDLETIARGESAVLERLAVPREESPAVAVCDATLAGDLEIIARVAARLDPPPLLCGSAGLAAHVAAAFGLQGAPAPSPAPGGGGVLILAGSHHPHTRHQLEIARKRRGLPLWELAEDVAEQARARLSRSASIAVATGTEAGKSREEVGRDLRALARLGRLLAESGELAGIAVTGGWTAIELLGALEAGGVEILAELDTGVPLCRVADGPCRGLLLATKAGALGGEETFVRIVDRLSAAPPAGRPLLAITLGDPCGIGPEIVVRALSEPEVYRICRPLVVGHPVFLREAARFSCGGVSVRQVETPEEGLYQLGTIDVLSPVSVAMEKIRTGQVCPEAGRVAARWVETAADLALAGRVDGIVTAPLNKEAMRRAGVPHAGHTELLGERTGTRDYRMMLASEALTVVHATTHVALHDVPSHLTAERIFTTIALAHQALEDLGIPHPRLGVAGLNPHAGESGLFGSEEIGAVRPAVMRAQAQGWQVEGPLPPDTLFLRASRKEFDAAIAMYHDQGHIPVKLLAFADAVNVTLGLPIARTSVDHGTAFDIAGQGVADAGNLVQAIRLGARLGAARTLPEEGRPF